MKFEDAYDRWQDKRLTREQAAQLPGVCERTFRRYIDRYQDDGLEGSMDKRISEVSSRKAPVDEVLRMETLYKERYDGWSVKHFFERYQDEHQGRRSCTWVKSRLQESDLAPQSRRRGKQRRRRPRAPLTGMMIHQDGSTHEWVPGQVWDLIVTMDDANSEVYPAFLVEEEGTLSSFQGVKETLRKISQGASNDIYGLTRAPGQFNGSYIYNHIFQREPGVRRINHIITQITKYLPCRLSTGKCFSAEILVVTALLCHISVAEKC